MPKNSSDKHAKKIKLKRCQNVLFKKMPKITKQKDAKNYLIKMPKSTKEKKQSFDFKMPKITKRKDAKNYFFVPAIFS